MSGDHDVDRRPAPTAWRRLWRRHPTGPTAAVKSIDRLADRYLDPTRRFERNHDLDRQALCEAHPEAAKRWARRLALHRAMVGAAGERSGLEERRTLSLVIERVEVRPTRRWWLGLPIVVMAALILVVIQGSPTQDEWIAVRGGEASVFEPRVGLGVGGIDVAGSEYEVVASGAVQAGDWLRFSYTNERSDLGWLFVVGLRGDGIVWLFPLPSDGASVPIGLGDRTSLPFESRVPEASADGAGDLLITGLFTATPLTVDAMRRALESLPSGLPTRLDSGFFELEVHLRLRLGLAATDVVQVVNTRIAPHPSPADPAAPTLPTTPNDHGPNEEAP